MSVEFTEEELEAIAASMERYAAMADADAPGMTTVVPVKVKDAMTAQALTQYVEDLIVQLGNCGEDEAAAIMDRAIKAQLKAYAVHSLPVYLFQAAGMFEFIGDGARAQHLFRDFLRAQDEFDPDQVDTVFLNQTDIDLPEVIALAKEKLGIAGLVEHTIPDKVAVGTQTVMQESQAEIVENSWTGELHRIRTPPRSVRRLWKIPLWLLAGALSLTHLSWVIGTASVIFRHWSWFYLLSPAADLCLGLMFYILFCPLQWAGAASAYIAGHDRWTGKTRAVLVAVAVLVGTLFVLHFVIWGSFPIGYDKTGHERLRLIPFIPWPDNPFWSMQ